MVAISALFQILMIGGGAVAGGFSVQSQQAEMCKKTQELSNSIDSLTKNGKIILKNYKTTYTNLKNDMLKKQGDVIKLTQELNKLKETYDKTYQISQWFAGGIFLLVAIALYLKHQGVLTTTPVAPIT